MKLYVISHTHWDREWYESFQRFRVRLVNTLDGLLDILERDPEYRCFHMDGQTIMLEDYLEIRPENRARLEKLVRQGRILIGPWYTQPDEFLLTGESLVRNLQRGCAVSRAFGVEPLKIGYVVDIFGHNSQFPQILRGFGISAAILYRGAGDFPKDTFIWAGADGSEVLAMKLDPERSYSNFYFAIRRPFDGREFDTAEVVKRLKALIEFSQKRAVSPNLLMMDGVDHIAPDPRLPRLLAAVRSELPEIEICHATLEEYEAALRAAAPRLETIRGELYNVGRRGLNNTVLKNVLSSMPHLKQLNDHCERLLARWAEFLAAGAGPAFSARHRAYLDLAWKTLLQNHPHDSICGCSMTNIHQDNENRFAQVLDLADEVLRAALDEITGRIDTACCGERAPLALFNPLPQPFEGIAEAELEFPLDSSGNFKLFDSQGREIACQILGLRRKVLHKRILKALTLASFPKKDYYRVAFKARVPPCGYALYSCQEYRTEQPGQGDYTYKQYYPPTRYPGTQRVDSQIWENKFLRVSLADSSALRVHNRQTGKIYPLLPVFEDGGDVGDGWNYVKPMVDRNCLSSAAPANIAVEHDGPLVTTWLLKHSLAVPATATPDKLQRSTETVPLEIQTRITLRQDSPVLEFQTRVENTAEWHRLRVIFPTHLKTETFHTSTPFAFGARPIKKTVHADANEIETGVYPNQGVIWLKDSADSFALFNRGLYEVEVTEDASRALCLTLFRSVNTDWFETAQPMGYLKRPLVFDYALEFGAGSRAPHEVMQSGEAWRTGLKEWHPERHGGPLPPEASFLKVEIPGAILSCFKARADGAVIVRLYNCAQAPAQGVLRMRETLSRAWKLNLNEESPVELPCPDGILPVELKGAEVATFALKMAGKT